MDSRRSPSRPARYRGVVVVSLAVGLTAAVAARGGVYTESGPDGMDGAAGTTDPGMAGGNVSHVETGPDLTNSVTLNGGNGGAGGTAGGPGGAGGSADAMAGANNYVWGASIIVEATAIGGSGGAATGPGQPGRGGDATASASANGSAPDQTIGATGLAFAGAGGDLQVGVGNTAGDGGAAVASGQGAVGEAALGLSLTAIGGAGGNVLDGWGNGGRGGDAINNGVNAGSSANDRGADFYTPELDVNVALVGGSGGQGSGVGFLGGNGAAPVVQPVSTIGFGSGDVGAGLSVTGGSGGAGVNGALPGQGAAVSLTDMVFGGTSSPTSTLYLSQTAIAGAGGAADTGVGAAGATASSSLARANDGGGVLNAHASAVGGAGGDGIGSGLASGGQGGDAMAQLSGVNQAAASATVSALGGAGGNANSGTGDGGKGANGAALGWTQSVASDPTLYVEATGGAGGSGRGVGHHGGDGGFGSVPVAHVDAGAPGASLGVTAHVTGGDGGQGFDGADGGNGAFAYIADAVTASPVAGDTTATASLSQVAVGGKGGDAEGGGNPGVGGPGQSSLNVSQPVGSLTADIQGTGGDGGSTTDGPAAAIGGPGIAFAHLSAPGAVYGHIIATGGNGGDSTGSASPAGAGGEAFDSPSSASSTTGSVTLDLEATGGDGGSHYGTTYGNGGGNGATVRLTDTLDGDSPVSVHLTQTARGGRGGYSDCTQAGLAGNAFSTLNRTKSNTASLRVATTAVGGEGGSQGYFGVAMDGGVTTANAQSTNTGGASAADASAVGGLGGMGSFGAGGGNGGFAEADATSNTTGGVGGASDAHASAVGGAGGKVSYIPTGMPMTGGFGGAALVSATATGAGGAPVSARAEATGGAGGSPDPYNNPSTNIVGNGGMGGPATATATGTAGTGALTVDAAATGGAGGQGLTPDASRGVVGAGGNGGDASATAAGSGAGTVNVAAHATGGYTPSGGAGRTAAVARATGSGASGSVAADAAVNRPDLLIATRAQSPAAGANASEARASTGRPAPEVVGPLPTNVQAFAYLAGSPVPGDVTGAMLTSPNARTLLDTGTSGGYAVALAAMGVGYAPGATGSQAYSSKISLSVDTSGYAAGEHVYLALLSPESAGAFSDVTLQVFRESNDSVPPASPMVNKTFATLAAAQDYLRDHVLDIGLASGAFVNGFLDLDVVLSGTTSTPGARLATTAAVSRLDGAVNRWVGPYGGSVSDPANWSAGVVPAAGGALNFVNHDVGYKTVDVPGDVVFSTINLDTVLGATFDGTGRLVTTADPSGHRAIQVAADTIYDFNVPVLFRGNTEVVGGRVWFKDGVTLEPGVNVTVRGGADAEFSELGPTSVSDVTSITVKDGSSASIFDDAVAYSVGPRLTVLNDGQFGFRNTGYVGWIDGGGRTLVAGNASVSQIRQHELVVSPQATLALRPDGVSRLESLVLSADSSGAATFDLADGVLVLDYAADGQSPVAAVRAAIRQARHGGDWLGTTFDGSAYRPIITSSAAAADPHLNRTIALVDCSLLPADVAELLALGEAVDASSLVLRYALYGDANLDGRVNADDYALLDRGVARGLAASWVTGDFDQDGVLGVADYMLIDKSFLIGQGSTFDAGSFLARREAQFGAAYVSQLVASVPEPSSAVGVIGLAVPLVLRRRRRRGA